MNLSQVDMPGPGQYHQGGKNSLFGMGNTYTNWHTSVGAFGSTEKRFVQKLIEIDPLSGIQNPGPGDYDVPDQMGRGVKYVTRKIRGRTVRLRSEMPSSSVFRSATGRSLE